MVKGPKSDLEVADILMSPTPDNVFAASSALKAQGFLGVRNFGKAGLTVIIRKDEGYKPETERSNKVLVWAKGDGVWLEYNPAFREWASNDVARGMVDGTADIAMDALRETLQWLHDAPWMQAERKAAIKRFLPGGIAWLLKKRKRFDIDSWEITEVTVTAVGRVYVTVGSHKFRRGESKRASAQGLVRYYGVDYGEGDEEMLFPSQQAAESYVATERLRKWAGAVRLAELPPEALQKIKEIYDTYIAIP